MGNDYKKHGVSATHCNKSSQSRLPVGNRKMCHSLPREQGTNRTEGKILEELSEAAVDFAQVEIMPKLGDEGAAHARLARIEFPRVQVHDEGLPLRFDSTQEFF